MSWTARITGSAVAAALVMSVAACSVEGREVLCPNQYTYQGRSYVDVANATITPGKKLGVATQPACDDRSDDPDVKGTAYEVVGVSPEVAIAIGDTPETATLFAVESGPDLAPEVRRLVDAS
ncbi:DUF6281 family protein [Streptomyces sp. NBC_00102]|uniref:DUF6281 family protein n=1 Tax=Streptomyces sp. NBC_00102 TaxID=2975652 RepID=UPI0022557441|nr:DUF6281 family protein [Streptomyces sp. NBC_00102]MCX5398832.1 DUF6281 family protein [Streptomyces sp. NBC_00102]